jgi:hypothetical protein
VRINLKTPVFVSIAIACGAIVLIGYFVELPLLVDLRGIFMQWAVILAAIALLVGIVNLILVHWKKVQARQVGSVYSIVLLIALGITLLVAGLFGPNSRLSLWLFDNLLVPVESSLMAVLAVVLVYACARLINRRINAFSLIFILTVLLVLVGSAMLPSGNIPLLYELRNWIAYVWASAGARGILLGVALGIIATGLRVLLGADRPYGG